MKKTLLIAVAALFVAIGANAQAKKMIGAQKPVCVAEQLNVQTKQMKADFKLPQAMRADMNINSRRAVADLNGTYILDSKNWDRDFTESTTFTIQAESGTIELDQYEKDEETGKYPTFDYNVKLTDFTYGGAVAYGQYDEEAGQIVIPVQTIVAEKGSYGRIVFSALVLDKDDAPLVYGYSMVLNVYSDGSIEIDEGDFTEEAAEEPAFEGAYIGGFFNFLPDYEEQPNAAWNYGFEAETFTPNAVLGDVEVHIEGGAWGDWTRAQYPVCVEDFDTEIVVHNFFGLCPISISVDGDKAGIATPVRVMEYDYADEGEDPNYIQIWQWDANFENILNPGLITGNIADEDGMRYIEFYDTEYKEAWTDEYGEHEAGNYIITDYTKWFMVHSTYGEKGAYWWGEARNVYIAIPTETTGISELKNDGRQQASKTYNLMGQEVNAAAKGLVIKDGKKMIVK